MTRARTKRKPPTVAEREAAVWAILWLRDKPMDDATMQSVATSYGLPIANVRALCARRELMGRAG